MAISDKTRKVLWARSGNRCAICRQKLVADKTETDSDSVVGEECHIVSRARQGPRSDPEFPLEHVDQVENLILLCAVHHKIVDDQIGTYTPDRLQEVKSLHEDWVDSKLAENQEVGPVRVRRFRQNVPTHMFRVTSGHTLLELSCHCMYPYYGDNLLDYEAEIIGGFFQDIQDWRDIFDDLGMLERMRAMQSITRTIEELESHGFWVFAATEKQRIEGGIAKPSNWNALHLSVLRESDPSIIRPEGDVMPSVSAETSTG